MFTTKKSMSFSSRAQNARSARATALVDSMKFRTPQDLRKSIQSNNSGLRVGSPPPSRLTDRVFPLRIWARTCLRSALHPRSGLWQ